MTRPILAVELEDVLAVRDGSSRLWDLDSWEPRSGSRQFLARAVVLYDVAVLSVESSTAAGRERISSWCWRHYGELARQLRFPEHLPAAVGHLSSRAIRFRADRDFPDPRFLLDGLDREREEPPAAP